LFYDFISELYNEVEHIFGTSGDNTKKSGSSWHEKWQIFNPEDFENT